MDTDTTRASLISIIRDAIIAVAILGAAAVYAWINRYEYRIHPSDARATIRVDRFAQTVEFDCAGEWAGVNDREAQQRCTTRRLEILDREINRE